MYNDALDGRAAAEPKSFSVLRPRAISPVLLVCDHASNRVPHEFAGMGIERSQLCQHIGWDIGAAEVTRQLSGLLQSTAVMSGVSRLVIDCNRALDESTSIPSESDGVAIPANQGLAVDERRRRAAAWFHPYHRAIATQLKRIERGRRVATVISIHSFTPVMDGRRRPWPVGVLWDHDWRLAPSVIQALAKRGYLVGDNEPYSGRGGAFTTDTHAASHGRPHITFEIRQDLIANSAGARLWGMKLADVLRPALKGPELKKRKHY